MPRRLAAGDPRPGKKVFNQCQTCHVVADEAGDVLAGKNAKTGPNLYGVIGRAAASLEGFKYGDGIIEAAAKGLVWDEANFAVYVQDPTKFLTRSPATRRPSQDGVQAEEAEDAARGGLPRPQQCGHKKILIRAGPPQGGPFVQPPRAG